MTKKELTAQIKEIDVKLSEFIQEEIELKDELDQTDYLHDTKEFVHYEAEFTRIQGRKDKLTGQKNWLLAQLERK